MGCRNVQILREDNDALVRLGSLLLQLSSRHGAALPEITKQGMVVVTPEGVGGSDNLGNRWVHA
eukprot:73539-Hanusia_phi.AAC.2